MELNETITGTETIYDGKVIRVRRHTVTLPNGKPGVREVVLHRGAVAVVALDTDDTVLLVRQFRLPAGKPLLEIVAGGLEANESPAECARRELREEIGKECAELIPLFAAYMAPGYCDEKIYGFLATGLSDSRLDGDEDEFVETVALPLREALEAIDSGVIEDAKTIAGLTLTARRLSRL